MLYRALDQDQPDSYCCVPTTASMEIDAATAGMKRPAVEGLRKATGIAHPYGISYISIAEAALEVSNVRLQPRYGLSRDAVANIAPGGSVFGISVEMSRIGYSRPGGHTIYVHAYSVHPGGFACDCEKKSAVRHSEFTIQDPGTWTVGYKQISASKLFGAAEARTGNRGINVLVAPDTTWVWRKRVATGYVREKPTTKSKSLGRIQDRPYRVKRIVSGQRYYVNGHYSPAWYEIAAGGFIRGDKLSTYNVPEP